MTWRSHFCYYRKTHSCIAEYCIPLMKACNYTEWWVNEQMVSYPIGWCYVISMCTHECDAVISCRVWWWWWAFRTVSDALLSSDTDVYVNKLNNQPTLHMHWALHTTIIILNSPWGLAGKNNASGSLLPNSFSDATLWWRSPLQTTIRRDEPEQTFSADLHSLILWPDLTYTYISCSTARQWSLLVLYCETIGLGKIANYLFKKVCVYTLHSAISAVKTTICRVVIMYFAQCGWVWLEHRQ